ncbi:MAG: DJ-1/PfpI family protein [Verrucomicrobiae bacterium]|nr:DJ-1/PfpI family protein [Verrucomicrobiae bacterium]
MASLPSTPSVLVLLVPGFEEIETVTPIDLLRRAGARVVVASVTGEPAVTGRCQMTLHADTALADVIDQPFDLLVIPGGPGVQTLRTDGRAARLARAQVEAGRPVAAICAAPTVLADAGLLQGRRFTAHASVLAELPGPPTDQPVVEDGPIITSRGAGTALEFGLALVRRLFGPDIADAVARAIMLKP